MIGEVCTPDAVVTHVELDSTGWPCTVHLDSGLVLDVDDFIARYTKVAFEVGQVWKHKMSGKLYKITGITNIGSLKTRFPLMITYGDWTCTAASFYSRMRRMHD